MSAARAMGAVARRPSLWRTAAVEGVRLIPPRWWSRRPHLPVPDRDFLAFRMETQYGDRRHSPTSDDVISWLRWCKAFEQTCRRPPGSDR